MSKTRTYITHPDGKDITDLHGLKRVTTIETLEKLIVEDTTDFWWSWRSWKPSVRHDFAVNSGRQYEALAALTGADPLDEAVRLAPRIVKRVRRLRSRADGGAIDSLGHNFGPMAEAMGISRRPDPAKGEVDPFELYAADPRAYLLRGVK